MEGRKTIKCDQDMNVYKCNDCAESKGYTGHNGCIVITDEVPKVCIENKSTLPQWLDYRLKDKAVGE